MITLYDIEIKRNQVRRVYKNFGLSKQYDSVFEELHELNILFMAQQHQENNGLLPQPN